MGTKEDKIGITASSVYSPGSSRVCSFARNIFALLALRFLGHAFFLRHESELAALMQLPRSHMRGAKRCVLLVGGSL